MKKDIFWFRDISKRDVEVVGEKAAYLGEISNDNIHVPPGFVLSTSIYNYFVKQIKDKINEILIKVDYTDFNSMNLAYNEISRLFSGLDFPESLKNSILDAYRQIGSSAELDHPNITDRTMELIKTGRDLPDIVVRVSPTKAIPTIIEPALNIRGIEQLIVAVRNCWAAYFSPRALYLRYQKNIDWQDIEIPIIIQKLISPLKSGDLFTLNPVTNNTEQMLIQTIWGFNIGGMNNPTSLIINKNTHSLIEASINSQQNYIVRDAHEGRLVPKALPPDVQNSQILSRGEIDDLSKIALKIESMFNFPQHIEWGIEKERIYILQARKIIDIFKTPPKKTTQESQLNGLFVSSGSAEGTAKMVLSPSDMDKIEKGDIFVTSEASKEFLSALMKSSALINGGSGLTSYAGFISRELGIPCLIGAKKAANIADGYQISLSDNSVSIREPVKQVPIESEYGGSPSTSSQFTELEEYIKRLSKYIADLNYKEAEKRRSGEYISPEEEERAKLLSEIEWQIRDMRQKLQRL